MPTREQFITAINKLIAGAKLNNEEYIDINAGTLHRSIGRYPNNGDHRMPVCNSAMRDVMQQGDQILEEPPSGQGASLTIRYILPRVGNPNDE